MAKLYVLLLLVYPLGLPVSRAGALQPLASVNRTSPVGCTVEKSPVKAVGIGLQADYYIGANFEKPFMRRTDAQIDFQWTRKNRPPGANDLLFSVRWTGKLLAPVAGVYRFVVTVDDGARLWVGGTLLLERWKEFYPHSKETYTREVYLEAGQYYSLKLEYFNFYGSGNIKLFWELPKSELASRIGINGHQPRTLIPKENLFSAPLSAEEELLAATETAENVGSTETLSQKKKVPVKSDPPATTRKTSVPKPTTVPATLSGNTAPVTFFENEERGKPETGKTLVLKNVLFEQSKYVLLPESFPELDRLVKLLQQYSSVRIEVAGHTDNVGDAKLNQMLSEQRAQVVATYLIRKGIAATRIQTRGYGGTRPIADNTHETERAKNRRVAFTVLSE